MAGVESNVATVPGSSGTPSNPTAPFPFAPDTLTYTAGSVAINAADTDLYHLTLTGSGATVGKPTNLQTNTRFILVISQDATGSRTVLWNPVYAFGPNGVPILSTTARANDYFACIYWAAGALYSGSAEVIHVIATGPGFLFV